MIRAFKLILKIVIGIILVIAVLVGVFLLVANYKETHYDKVADPAGEIEKQYTKLGDYEVSHISIKIDDSDMKSYEIYYPSEIETSEKKYPLVIMANGTGYPVSKYKEVLKHLASWGFIVAGNEDEQSRSGESSAMTLDYMTASNEDHNSIFYQKIDIGHIGISGHSQGGVGAIHAVTEQPNGSMYGALWTGSATSPYWGQDDVLGDTWSYDVSKIHIPYLMVAGTGSMDAGSATDITAREGQGICPLWSLNNNYDLIAEDVPKVMGRLAGRDHGEMARFADGYMTAWFVYWLQENDEAGKAFFGENPEIVENENWQDVRVNDVQKN